MHMQKFLSRQKWPKEYLRNLHNHLRRLYNQILNMLFMSLYGACFTFKDKPVGKSYSKLHTNRTKPQQQQQQRPQQAAQLDDNINK